MRKNSKNIMQTKITLIFFYLLLKDALGLLVTNGRKEVIFCKAHQAF